MFRYADLIQCSWADAQGLVNRWKEEGIGGVINMAHNTPDIQYDPWLRVLRFPHLDDEVPAPDWIRPVLAFYDWARVRGKVIVHCAAGANRSVGCTASILVARHGKTADEALRMTGQPGYHHWSDAVRQVRA